MLRRYTEQGSAGRDRANQRQSAGRSDLEERRADAQAPGSLQNSREARGAETSECYIRVYMSTHVYMCTRVYR